MAMNVERFAGLGVGHVPKCLNIWECGRVQECHTGYGTGVNACKLSDSADMLFPSSWRQNVMSRAAVRIDRVAPPCGISTAILTLDYCIFEYASPRSSKPIPPELIAVFATCGWMFVLRRGY